MDGFTGFKTATAEELPDAVAVMDPFHVVRLAGDALDRCRRRVQQDLHGHRGRAHEPLYKARRTLHTGVDLLADKQTARIEALFAVDEHVEVEATWGIYQRMITAYRHPDRAKGRALMSAVIAGKPPGDLLFTTAGGSQIWRSTSLRRLDWAKTGQGRRLHDLRRTAACLWLARGVEPGTVQAWCGHESIATTNQYLHFLGTDADRAGLNKLNDGLGSAGGARDARRRA